MCSLDSMADSISSGSVLDSEAVLCCYSAADDCESVFSDTKTALSFCDSYDSDELSVYYVEDSDSSAVVRISPSAEQLSAPSFDVVAALDELESELEMLTTSESDFDICAVGVDNKREAHDLKVENVKIVEMIAEAHALQEFLNKQYEELDNELSLAEESLKGLCDSVHEIVGIGKKQQGDCEVIYDRQRFSQVLGKMDSPQISDVGKSIDALASFEKNVGNLRDFMGDIFNETMSRELIGKVDSLSTNVSALQEDFHNNQE